MEDKKVVFISGNTDLTEKNFMLYYAPDIKQLVADGAYFILSDDEGCAEMTQKLLNELLPKDQYHRVTVFCMFDPKIIINSGFIYLGNFQSLEERNAAMTIISNLDLHIIMSGKGKKATEGNLLRRYTMDYNYHKFILQNYGFWSNLFDGLKEKTENAE